MAPKAHTTTPVASSGSSATTVALTATFDRSAKRSKTPPVAGSTTLGRQRIITGDCRQVLKTLPDGSGALLLSDPPYEYKLHGCRWNCTGVATDPEVWAQSYRVAKPGAYALIFAGPQTSHRMICAIEDAGFMIRGKIVWARSNGMPKGRRLTGEVSSYHTALKPLHEEIIVAQKPPGMTFQKCMETHGVGARNIEASRIPLAPGEDLTVVGDGGKLDTRGDGWGFRRMSRSGDLGRWPGDVILSGPAADALEEQEPGASRFFYVARPERGEKDAGLDGARNPHNTVKPIALLRHLIRLHAGHADGEVIDMFAGSGSTGCAAALEGRPFTGIELDADYADAAY
ncbi:MAG: methylase family protein, partial [Chthonomonadaceae bacterium]|nr:methylase family protein [Chthonomonadaceae bacterium]